MDHDGYLINNCNPLFMTPDGMTGGLERLFYPSLNFTICLSAGLTFPIIFGVYVDVHFMSGLWFPVGMSFQVKWHRNC